MDLTVLRSSVDKQEELQSLPMVIFCYTAWFKKMDSIS